MNFDTLKDRSLIEISGEDADSFLANLITCDIEGLGDEQARFGALLTPQGKILFDFHIFKIDDVFHLDVATSKAEELAKRLTFYRLRAKVDISEPKKLEVTTYWNCEHPYIQGCMVLADGRHDELGFRAYGDHDALGEAYDYTVHRIDLCIPESGLDFDYGEAYPHETLMDQFGGVDFKKGCYVGQEVVSRMQHRGTAKKRFVKIIGKGELPTSVDDIIADGKPAGVLGSRQGDRGIALVRLDRIAEAATVLIDNVEVSAELADWVNFDWPGETS